MIEAKI